ncbi:MAG: caspase family protein [Bacteroidales bacterium]|nr:caspase family protein [Bacteroidales bacterium]
MKKLIIVITVLFFCFSASSQERRLALIIGNGNYTSSTLSNPENDAKSMEKSLKALGFKVIRHENLTQSKLTEAIDNFGNKLKYYDVGLFFYAGHGIQAKGFNYLIPVDAVLKAESDVEYSCVRADRIFGKMEEAQNKMNIVILDACRDNPFERSWTRAARGRGLTFMDAPSGSIIAYATAPGKTASDGYGENSPYTSALIQCMEIPNIKIEDFFKKVRAQVREQTKDQQTPWESTSLEGDFYFYVDAEHALQETQHTDATQLVDNSVKELKRNAAPEIKSLAILPFANYSGDETQAYLALGMQDALISEIGQLGTIRVISKTSTFSYTNTSKTIQEIAYELDVDAIMEASIMTIQDNIRLHLKLYNAYPEEKQIWSQTFDSDMSNIFNLYNDVIKTVANEIQISLSPEQQNQLEKTRQINPDAYQAYLKGKSHLFSLTRESLEAALDYFQKAVKIDPEYAPAYGGMAGVWGVLKQMDYVSPDEANPKMKEYMSKAIELDSENADVYFYDAVVKVWTDFDWVGAEKSFKKCLEINPNYSEAWAYYSHFLMCMKRPDEMRETMKRALEIDPYNYLIQILAGVELTIGSEYDLSINEMSQLQTIMPNNPLIMVILFQCYAETGKYDLAINELKKILNQVADETVIKTLDKEYSKAGFKKALNATADVLVERSSFVSAQHMATLYGYAGNTDKMLIWLEKMYIRGDPDLPYIGVMPLFRPYQDEPRYIEIVQRMNLPLGKFE